MIWMTSQEIYKNLKLTIIFQWIGEFLFCEEAGRKTEIGIKTAKGRSYIFYKKNPLQKKKKIFWLKYVCLNAKLEK